MIWERLLSFTNVLLIQLAHELYISIYFPVQSNIRFLYDKGKLHVKWVFSPGFLIPFWKFSNVPIITSEITPIIIVPEFKFHVSLLISRLNGRIVWHLCNATVILHKRNMMKKILSSVLEYMIKLMIPRAEVVTILKFIVQKAGQHIGTDGGIIGLSICHFF